MTDPGQTVDPEALQPGESWHDCSMRFWERDHAGKAIRVAERKAAADLDKKDDES